VLEVQEITSKQVCSYVFSTSCMGTTNKWLRHLRKGDGYHSITSDFHNQQENFYGGIILAILPVIKYW